MIFFPEFISTDREDLEDFSRAPLIGRAISAQPDFAKPVDVEDEVEWSKNSIYHGHASKNN